MKDVKSQYNLMRLKELQEATGCITLKDTCEYVLLHYLAFDKEFIEYCETWQE